MAHTYRPAVQRVMDAEGISSDELEHMLERATITSKTGFNRRWYHWMFAVSDSEVVRMASTEVREVGRGRDKMHEDCEDCSGSGCKTCGWHGSIIRRI